MAEKNTYNFMFSHLVVREVVFKHKDSFLTVLGADIEKARIFLSSLWQKHKADSTLIGKSEGEVWVTRVILEDKTPLMVITMPPPEEEKEVLYIGITLEENMQYYVFERTFAPKIGGILWELAKWEKDERGKFRHIHLAMTSNNTPNGFVNSVNSIRKK